MKIIVQQNRTDGGFRPSVHVPLESIPTVGGPEMGIHPEQVSRPSQDTLALHSHLFKVSPISLKFMLNCGRKVKESHMGISSTYRLCIERPELESTPTPSVLNAQREYSVNVATVSYSAGGRI